MKRKYAVLLSGVAVLALVTGILMGREIFSKEEKQKTEATAGLGKQEVSEENTKDQKTSQEGQTTESQPTSQEQQMLLIYDIEDGYMQVPYLNNVPNHTYDWNNLHEKNGFKYYIDGEGKVSRIGIDVSYFQDKIDWTKVKNAGVNFVMLRMGFRGYSEEGKLVVDEKFHQYIKEAQAAGLDTGVYFFSQAVNEEEAIEEAEFVYQECKDYELTCPVAFDTEKIKGDTARTDNLKPEELTDITIAFCEKIKEYGYEPMIYANAKWLTTKLQLERLTDYPVWYADYQENPLYPYSFEMWQYTESGQIDGIEGNVDFNIWFSN